MRSIFFVLAAMLLSATAAYADDYRFNVPVRIENMRFAENVRVECGALYVVGGATRSVNAHTPVTLVSGAFHGTVVVSVTLPSGVLIADVHRQECFIVYQWRLPGGALDYGSYLSVDDRNAAYVRATGQAIDTSATWHADR